MPRKPKNDAPPGGWDCPGYNPDLKPVRYAAGTKVVNGKVEWVWKPVDAKYLAECAALKSPVAEKPAIRVRTRQKT
jgi:hypothetical protein